MFCMECGTKLPDGAKFCMNCGTRVGTMPAAGSSVSPSPAGKAPAAKQGICSERNQSMVYVPNVGLFFIVEENSIAFLPQGEKKCKKAVRKSPNKDYILASLAWYDGLLYYWMHENDSGKNKLMFLDPVTLEKKKAAEYDCCQTGYLGCGNVCMALYGNAYYTVKETQLVSITLPDGTVTVRDLPDLRNKPLPEDWKQPTGYITVDEETREKKNYGERPFTNFRTTGGYGFVSLNGGAPCTICFPLDDPEEFTFMPLDCCTGYKEMGPLTVVEDTLYSGMRGLKGTYFWKTPISPDGTPGKSVRLLDLGKNGLYDHGMDSWWRMGSRIYTGQFFYDISKEKFYKLPAWTQGGSTGLNADDYAEDDRGGCYVYAFRKLYHFPAGWETSGTDLDDFLIEEFD